jgi:hypothetical protein
MLLRDTVCACVATTLSNSTCLCVLEFGTNYFVKKGFVNIGKVGKGLSKGEQVLFLSVNLPLN